jgi:large subunit ribosomal protein L29
MKLTDLRKKSDTELAEELLGLRREQFNLRMQRATGQLGRPDQFAKVRKNIARIKTLMAEKVRQSKAANQNRSGSAA